MDRFNFGWTDPRSTYSNSKIDIEWKEHSFSDKLYSKFYRGIKGFWEEVIYPSLLISLITTPVWILFEWIAK